jgi:glyoxylase-like metal-dependent hydrolase (beta-lactamase superfamily II)
MQTEFREFTAGNIRVIQTGELLGGECFLLLTPKSAFLYDCGFAFSAGLMTDRLKRALEGRPLDYILLTHSHFDHVGGSAAVAELWPEAKIVAHKHAAETFKKENARTQMKKMDASAARGNNMPAAPELFDRLRVDIMVGDGDCLQAADQKLIVLEGLGHTRDSLGFYFPGEKLLASCESACILIHGCGERPIPEFVVSYKQSMETIDRFEAMGAEHLLVPHYGIKSGDELGAFFRDAREVCAEVADFALSGHRQGYTVDDIAQKIAERYHNGKHESFQTAEAFIINMQAMVPRLIQEYEDGEIVWL